MSSLPNEEWRLKTNAQYMEVMKVLMNLATASLVLPIFFVKTFISPNSSCNPLATYLDWWAYGAWICLILSLASGMLFYWASAKYVKVVSGGKEKALLRFTYHKEDFRSVNWFEKLRDGSAIVTVVFFIAGLIFSLYFFTRI